MLLSADESVHGNPQRLLQAGTILLHEAQRVEQDIPHTQAVLKIVPILEGIKEQVAELEKKEYEQARQRVAQEGGKFDRVAWLNERFNMDIDTAAQTMNGKSESEQDAIVLQKYRDRRDEALSAHAQFRDRSQESAWAKTPEVTDPIKGKVPEKFVNDLEGIWSKIVREEDARGLSSAELLDYKKKIIDLEHKAQPREMMTGTKGFESSLRAIHDSAEQKLNALSAIAVARKEKESPMLSTGKQTKKSFLENLSEPGQFGHMLRQNPHIRELLSNYDEDAAHFRDQVFLKLHKNVLNFRRDSSNDSFGLYERGDFTTFVNMITSSMSQRKDTRSGSTVGQRLGEHYVNLSNAIRLSRDIDYQASQPGGDMKTFTRIAALYQNEYVQEGFAMPGVAQAFREYETTLRGIMNAHDGYIPPALVEYDAVSGDAYWDQRTKLALEKIAAQGQMRDVVRDKENSYLHKVNPDGRTVELDKTPESAERMKKMIEEDTEGLAVNMYMTLAKGFGMASLRYLEMFANSRVPGSDQPFHGMPGFHSIAGYEGTASALNFTSVVFHKFKIGSYKYFHLMNMLLPPEEALAADTNNAYESVQTYMAYRDGTLEKTNPKAKRLLDVYNFTSGESSLKSGWRYMDSSIKWTDKEREKLGGGARLLMAKAFAEERVQELLILNEFKERFLHDVVLKHNADLRRRNIPEEHWLPTAGPRFDALFDSRGRSIPEYNREINQRLLEIEGKQKDGKRVHTPTRHHYEELRDAYKKAYQARVWVEMVMRNPLTAAHQVSLDVPALGGKTTTGMSLHTLLLEKVLGISLEDLRYATVVEKQGDGPNATIHIRQKGGQFTTPTEEQRAHLNEVLDMEADLATVREIAIREQRDLRESDFTEAINGEGADHRRARALDYWKLCRQAMLGSDANGRAEELYRHIGLTMNPDIVGDYVVNWHVVEGIEKNLAAMSVGGGATFTTAAGEHISTGTLLHRAVNANLDKISMDDLAADQLDFMNLGSRSWVRKAGDIAAHVDGGGAMMEIFDKLILPTPDMNEIAKKMKEMIHIYGSDDIEIGYNVAGMLATAIDKLYSYDFRRGGSAAQKVVWQGIQGVEAWWPNERWTWWHTLEHADVLPPHGHSFDFGYDKFTIHDLMNKKRIMAQYWIQMILMGGLIAAAITAWQAAQQRDDEGGGGGGGGGHAH